MKKILGILMAAVMGISLAACSSKPGGTEVTEKKSDTVAETTAVTSGDKTKDTAKDTVKESGQGEEYKIGFCLQSMDVAVWNTMAEGMQAQADKLGNVTFNCQVANNDVSTQIANIENMIAQKYNAIIIHAFDREAFADVVKEALAAGIVICAYDDNIIDASTGEPVDYQLTFLCDNYEIGHSVGTMAANWTKANFEGEDKIQFGLLWHKEFQYQWDRVEGIKAAIAEIDPRIEIVEELEGLVTEDGVAAAETWIQSYPDLRGVVATNDTALLGYAEAWKAAGKDIVDAKFGMFGNDGVRDAIDLISDGAILRGDVGLDVYNGGADALAACVKVLNGEKADNVIMPMIDVTADTADEWKTDKNLYK